MSQFAFDEFADSLSRQSVIEDAIATDTWIYRDAPGKRRTARISVGRPRRIPRDPQRTWFCTVRISGWRRFVIPAFGIGPIDSLPNALHVVNIEGAVGA